MARTSMEMKGRAGYLQEPATGCGLRCHDLCRCGRGGARKKPEEGSRGKEGDDGRPPGRRRHPSKGCRPALISASAAGVPLQAGLHASACMLHRLCAVMCPGPRRSFRDQRAQLKSISLAFYCCSPAAPGRAGRRPRAARSSVVVVEALLACPYPLGATPLHVCAPIHST
jgi:hypothetical protein